MSGLTLNNVALVGSLGGAVVAAPVVALVSPYIGLVSGQSGNTTASAAFNAAFTLAAGVPWSISVIHRANVAAAHYVLNVRFSSGAMNILYGYIANCYELYTDSGTRVTGPVINPAVAHKIDIVYDGAKVLFSVDNVLAVTQVGVLPAFTPVSGSVFQINNPYGTVEMDTVRFTRSGVTIAEYLFSETSGLVAADTSGNGFNLTFNALTHY